PLLAQIAILHRSRRGFVFSPRLAERRADRGDQVPPRSKTRSVAVGREYRGSRPRLATLTDRSRFHRHSGAGARCLALTSAGSRNSGAETSRLCRLFPAAARSGPEIRRGGGACPRGTPLITLCFASCPGWSARNS